jgi:hypothetical protein
VEIQASGKWNASAPVAVNRRVGEDVAALTPHSAGRADFPLPVLHGRASLCGNVTADDAGAGKRVAFEQRTKDGPSEGLPPRASFQPLFPGPGDLLEVPTEVLDVPGDAVIGVVAYQLCRQLGLLIGNRLVTPRQRPASM